MIRRTAARWYRVHEWPPRAGAPRRWSVEERYRAKTNHRPPFTHLVTQQGEDYGCTCGRRACAHVAEVLARLETPEQTGGGR